MTVAAAAAFAVYHAFGLPQGYWAVFTAVIVVQTSIGATMNLALERMAGTIFGALVGAVAAWAHPRTPLELGIAIAASVLVTSFGAAARPRLKVAPVTAVIMLISPTGAAMGPAETAALRVVEIALGSLIGVAATLFVFPARAHNAAARRIAAVLDDIAAMIEGSAARLRGETVALAELGARIRSGLNEVEAAVAEAARERASRLGDDPLPEAFTRTLWRVRNDVVILARTAEDGLPEVAEARLGEAAQALLLAEAAFARGCGAALLEGRPPERDMLTQARARFGAAVEAIRRERLTRELTFEGISPYFGLVFAAESLQRNLGDLADRIEETQGRDRTGPRPTPAPS